MTWIGFTCGNGGRKKSMDLAYFQKETYRLVREGRRQELLQVQTAR